MDRTASTSTPRPKSATWTVASEIGDQEYRASRIGRGDLYEVVMTERLDGQPATTHQLDPVHAHHLPADVWCSCCR